MKKRGRERIDISRQYLEREYIKKKRTASSIAKDLNCSSNVVARNLKKHNIIIREYRKKVNISKDFLYEQYIDKGKSAKEIATELGCGYGTVFLRLQEHGIIPCYNNIIQIAFRLDIETEVQSSKSK